MGRGLFYLGIGAIVAYTAYLLFSADDRDDRPPRHSQSHESSLPPVLRHDKQQHHQVIDSPERPDHALVEAIQASLRTKAKQEEDFMTQYYQQTKDHARAKASSEEGKRNTFGTEKLHAEGSAAILSKNNRDQQIIGPFQRFDCAPAEVPTASLQAKAKQGDSSPVLPTDQRTLSPYLRRGTFRKCHTFQIDDTNVEASAAIFSENNQDRRIFDSFQRPNCAPIEVVGASLRAKAKQEAELMSQCYQQSHDAYERHDHARAKALSEEGKRHALQMEKLNAEASVAIFNENNQVKMSSRDAAPSLHSSQDRAACEVDLHGLYVKEAITYSEKAITDTRRRGDPKVRLIVGQGNHSDGNISRLKPAIQEDMRARGYNVEVDPRNTGVLVVQLSDE